MRLLIRSSLAVLFAVVLFARAASAATTAAQLVELARAGLDDDILIALIQTDGSTFQLTAADILALHRQGLSDKVIRAMQETARKPVPVAPVAPTPVEPVPAAGEDSQTQRAQVVQPVPPSVVNVYQTVTQKVESAADRGYPAYSSYSIPIAVPVLLPRAVQPRATPPVYWGFGGQRRPDSWDDGASRERRDDNNSNKDRNH